nr:aminotransferase class I/II-fold pyridoxal phosphate-dependent enzyme [Candidatus Sigynarchaeota archaeon]
MEFPSLEKTPIFASFSPFGKRVFLPNGIFYWAGLAKSAEINGTVGDAKGSELNEYLGIPAGKTITFFLKDMNKYLPVPEVSASIVSPYAPIAGLPDLRARWKTWIIDKCGLKTISNVEQLITLPIITCGVTNALYQAIRMFIGEKESIIVSDKYWENYDTIINLNIGANVEVFKTFDGLEFDIASMEKKVLDVAKRQGKAVILLNFPNNPTGYCPTPAMMGRIAGSLVSAAEKVKKPVIVIIDDAYEGYVYDPAAETRSLFGYLLNKHPMVLPVKLDGASKELLFYGGRVAFITFGLSDKWDVDLNNVQKDLENKVSGAIRGTNSNAAHIAELLVLKVMENMDKAIESRKKVIDVLSERYDIFKKQAEKLHQPGRGIYFDPYQGGFFAFLNLPASIPAEKFARKLLDEQKLGIIPVEKPELGVNGIRIAFCSMPKDAITTALDRIAKSLE